jgi:hypothetical protein
MPIPRNNRGADHLDPIAVFHAWSNLEEVIAYVGGVGMPDRFVWDGVLEGPMD